VETASVTLLLERSRRGPILPAGKIAVGGAAAASGRHTAGVRGWLVVALLVVELAPAGALGADAFISLESVTGRCPSRTEVATALDLRLPGATRARRGAGPRYRLDLERDGAAARLRLRDGAGALRLERRLAMPPTSGRGSAEAESCRALADAAALMVVRYLREIGYRSPTPVRLPDDPPAEMRTAAGSKQAPASVSPPAPAARAGAMAPADAGGPAAAVVVPAAANPPPAAVATTGVTPGASARPTAPARGPMVVSGAAAGAPAMVAAQASASARPSAILLAAGAAARAGLGGSGAVGGRAPARTEVTVGLQAQRGRLAAELAGGVSTETVVPVAGSAEAADLRLRAFPLRAGLAVPLAWGPGVFLPAVGVNVDLLAFRARGLVDARSGVRVEPAGEVGLGYRVGNRRWFVRGTLWGGLSLAPRDFDAGGEQPVFRTAASYVRVAVEGALALWKN
jgi:hypothetical protein